MKTDKKEEQRRKGEIEQRGKKEEGAMDIFLVNKYICGCLELNNKLTQEPNLVSSSVMIPVIYWYCTTENRNKYLVFSLRF